MSVEITPEYLARSGTEDGEQSALFCHAGIMEREADWRWGLLYAIPNGGKRGVATAARMAATGARTGFPDVGLPIAVGRYHGLFVELKKATGKPGDVGNAQKLWHGRLHGQGYCVRVAFGWQQAAGIITGYLAN